MEGDATALQQALAFAHSFAERHKHFSDKEKARAIYDLGSKNDPFLAGAFEQGVAFRYPHEVKGETNCHELAFSTYLLAQACGLQPRFFRMNLDNVAHCTVDVLIDGERTYLDPGWELFGPVVYYDDRHHKISIDGKRKTTPYDRITELSAQEVLAEAESLRMNAVQMIIDGQTLRYDKDGGIRGDHVQFGKKSSLLERKFTRSDQLGWHDRRIVRQREVYSRTGEQVMEETIFSNSTGGAWMEEDGEAALAFIRKGKMELAEDIPPPLKEYLRSFVHYKERAKDGFVHSDEEIETFGENARQQLLAFRDRATATGRRKIDSYLAFFDPAFDERLRMRVFDWIMTLSDPTTQLPEFDENVLRIYLQGHANLLETQGSKNLGAMENIRNSVVAALKSETHPTKEELLRKVRELHPSQAYQTFAEALEAKFGTMDIAEIAKKIQEHYPLFLVDPALKQLGDELLGCLQSAHFDRFYELNKRLVGTAPEDVWRSVTVPPKMHLSPKKQFSPETNSLTITVKADDAYGAYNSFLSLTYVYTDTGKVKHVDVEFYDGMEGAERKVPVFRQRVGSLGEITLVAVQEQARKNARTMQETRTLTAPQPPNPANFLTKNAELILFYSRHFDSPAPLFSEEETTDFLQKLYATEEWRASSVFFTPPEHKEAKTSLEKWKTLEAKKDPEFCKRVEAQMIYELLAKENAHEEAGRLVSEKYPTPEDQAVQLAKRHMMALQELGKGLPKAYVDAYVEQAAKGLQMRILTLDEIGKLSPDDSVKHLNDAVGAGRYDEVPSLLQHLPATGDKKLTDACLLAFQYKAEKDGREDIAGAIDDTRQVLKSRNAVSFEGMGISLEALFAQQPAAPESSSGVGTSSIMPI